MNKLTARRKSFSVALEAPDDPVDVSSAAQDDISQLNQVSGNDAQNTPIGTTDFGAAGGGNSEIGDANMANNQAAGMTQPMSGFDEMEPHEPEDPESVLKKRLQSNMIYFYHIIENNIQTLSENSTEFVRGNIPAVSKIIDDMSKCLDILYEAITKEFNTSSYISLMKKYVAIYKIYEVCVETLKIYLDTAKFNDKENLLKGVFADRFDEESEDIRNYE